VSGSDVRTARRTALFAVAVALLASACGTPEAGGEARERPVYRTGSNLPVKDPEEKSRTQVSAPATNPLPPVGMPPRPGG
jgi:hypothetical protein